MAKNKNSPAPPDGEGEKDTLDTCLKVLTGVQEQIRFADTKAVFVFAINTLMFGFVAGSVTTLKKALVLDQEPTCAWVGLATLLLFFLCAVSAVATLVSAVMSRFGHLAPKSRYFFGHIARDYGKDYAKYVSEVKAMTDGEWTDEVGTQIVETSHIAHIKHKLVKVAAIITLVGLVLWAITVLSVALL